jgi:putative selenate reductase
MAALSPQPVEVLLARALEEYRAQRRIFDFPRRSIWQGQEGVDLSVDHLGSRIATPLGPAAGPHTQLAQNLVIAWLGGARALELKTVQVNDQLNIGRPCIDAPDVGYNVEWSQELRLDESTVEYATAWMLIHVLAGQGIVGAEAGPRDFHFEVSVGYDFSGIRSAPVALLLDNLCDAGPILEKLEGRLPPALRPTADVEIPTRIASAVTLSTFHGCPPEEIERIVEHLFARHGVHVVIKLNPTLLGYEEVDSLLRGRLGYRDIVLDREAFDADLKWKEALGMFDRLSASASRAGLRLGAKLTNTLVVKNERQRLAGEDVYLSGPPLHPLAVTLAARLAEATDGRIPLSFSGGITAENFPSAVSCGFVPVTTCTDLLRPTGYRRLPRYLKALAAEMTKSGAGTVDEFIVQRAEVEPNRAALQNLLRYSSQVVDDPGYGSENHREQRIQKGSLALFDCESCNNCVLTCPNDAFFSLVIPPVALDTFELSIRNGKIDTTSIRFETKQDKQWAVYAGFCNECGNCDTFCPEGGGPYRRKPRFYTSRSDFEGAGSRDAILIEGNLLQARFSGKIFTLSRENGRELFSDGVVEAELNGDRRLINTRVLENREGHTLSLWPLHALLLLRDAVLAGVNPVSAPLLPVLREKP